MSNLISAAVQRRVVGSATRKSVLLYMADKAADDGSGVWTSKANIARDLELSRRAVQLAIQDLIRDGLIIEVGQRDCKHGFTVDYAIAPQAVDNLPSTREQGSPRERGAPQPVNHVHPNHPMNLTTTQKPADVPVDNSDAKAEPDPQDVCLEAAGPGLCPASRAAIVATAEVIEGWLGEGIELEADILPVIRQRTVTVRVSPIRTWGYFTDAVRAAHRARLLAAVGPKDAEKVRKPDIAAQMRFYADWVNSERFLPGSAITNTLAHRLLEAGLVTAQRLAARGIPFTMERAER